MKLYNKLVRDKIPDVIEADGRSCTTRVLDEREYVQELRVKLQEEVQEEVQELGDDARDIPSEFLTVDLL